MDVLHATALLVKCPHCGNKFNPEDAIGHHIKEQLEKDFDRKMQDQSRRMEEKIRKQEQEKYTARFQLMEEESKARAERLRELERRALTVEQREQQLKGREENFEIEMKKKFLEREKELKELAEKRATEKMTVELQEREQCLKHTSEMLEVQMKKRIQQEAEKIRVEGQMREAELQKKLDDQNKLLNEMKRKSDQGNMQLQGEVQEIAIEEYLEYAFLRDEVEEISKGKRGGDCVHVVKDHYDHVCGRILYESNAPNISVMIGSPKSKMICGCSKPTSLLS